MGEIAYGSRSHEEIYLLPSLCLQEIGEVCCASFDHGKDHRTQEIIMKEDKRSRCNFQGCIDFQGWKQFDGTLNYFFTITINITIHINSAPEIYKEEVDIKRRYWESI